jgi:uncharacterized membrane protein YdjX (TVP38/TMEM64 family)
MLTTSLVELLRALAAGGIGGAAVVFGLSRWLGSVWMGRILAGEKAKFDRSWNNSRRDMLKN